MSKPVLVLGSGGHASVILEILIQLNCKIMGVVSKEKPSNLGVFKGLKWYESDDDILSFDPSKVLLVNGIGSVPGNELRSEIFERFKFLNYKFMTIISKKSIVSKYAKISEGVQILNGVIVNANAKIDENTILNTGSIIEHDCVIGKHNHIAPGVTLSGTVITGNYVHIGTGASLANNLKIADNSVIGCGVSIVKDVSHNEIIIPAKNLTKLKGK